MIKHLAREIAKNLAMGIPAVRALRTRGGRNTQPLESQVRQMRDQFTFFIGTVWSVEGKVIAEIGPGHSIGLAALFLHAGAARYIAYDRFPVHAYNEYSEALYENLGCRPDPARITLRGAIEEAAVSPEADIVVSFD
jgi:hypothetical protein